MGAGLYKLVYDCLQYLTPVVMFNLIRSVEKGGKEKVGNIPTGVFFAVLLFFIVILQNWILNAYFHRTYRIGMNIRSFIVSSVLKKSLKINEGTSTGKVANFISNDASRIMQMVAYLHNLWSAPFQIVVAFTLLVLYIGPSAFVGLPVMIITLPLKKKLLGILTRMRKEIVKVTESRVKLAGDLLQGIRVVKLYAWEGSFLAKLTGVRELEMEKQATYIAVQCANHSMWNLTPMLVALVVFIVYAYTGGDTSASAIFTALALFRRVRFPIIVFPFILQRAVDFIVAIDRIAEFLMKPEVEGLKSVSTPVGEDGVARIKVSDGDFSWWSKEEDEEEKKEKQEEGKSKP